jgi:lipopolysaccharide heptosyltransferase II
MAGWPEDDWKSASNLLCVRLDALGDVLMTTPALRALREAHPDRRITLLTSPAGAEIAALIPEIDATITYAAPWVKASPPRPDAASDYAMADALRQRRFDGAVIFTVYSQSPLPAALLCYLADIPLRLAHCRENPYRLLTHWVPEPEPERGVRHEVRRQLDLVATLGCRTRDERMRLPVPETVKQRVLRLLQGLGVNPKRLWVVVHPGATAPSRRYPPERFARVAEQLVSDLGLQVVFTGTEGERPLIEQIRATMQALSFSVVGRMDLAMLTALLAAAPVLVTNNSGPAHVAAAVGTPVVDLYALTNPQHTPWAVESRVLFHDVPCRYCYKSVCPQGHHRCLSLVPPEDVVRATEELLPRKWALTGTTKALAPKMAQ